MTVIFGGAYQGKLDYALTHLDVTETDVCCCLETGPPDFGKKLLYGFHRYIYYLVTNGETADTAALCQKLQGKIIICNDISSGVVPVDATYRKWREETGRIMGALCRESRRVIRVFYGIGTVIS